MEVMPPYKLLLVYRAQNFSHFWNQICETEVKLHLTQIISAIPRYLDIQILEEQPGFEGANEEAVTTREGNWFMGMIQPWLVKQNWLCNIRMLICHSCPRERENIYIAHRPHYASHRSHYLPWRHMLPEGCIMLPDNVPWGRHIFPYPSGRGGIL